MKILIGLVALWLSLSPAALPIGASTPQLTVQRNTTVADVVRMAQAGISDEIIIARLRNEGKAFDLSTDDLIELKKGNVSNAVVKAMMNPSPSLQGTPASMAAPASAVVAADVSTPVTPAASVPVAALPDEQGVYVKVKGEWQSIDPEVVNMRTANMLGHAFSYGIAKAKVKGDIVGVKSRVQLASPVELLIKAAEGVSASEYQILQMELKGDRREFEAMQIGFANAKGGARKGLVEVKFEKVGKATYRGTINNVKRGEYGILPPGAVGSASTSSAGKMYGFGIIE